MTEFEIILADLLKKERKGKLSPHEQANLARVLEMLLKKS